MIKLVKCLALQLPKSKGSINTELLLLSLSQGWAQNLNSWPSIGMAYFKLSVFCKVNQSPASGTNPPTAPRAHRPSSLFCRHLLSLLVKK